MKIILATTRHSIENVRTLPVIGSTEAIPLSVVKVLRGNLKKELDRLKAKAHRESRYSDTDLQETLDEIELTKGKLEVLHTITSVHSRTEYLQYLSLYG